MRLGFLVDEAASAGRELWLRTVQRASQWMYEGEKGEQEEGEGRT